MIQANLQLVKCLYQNHSYNFLTEYNNQTKHNKQIKKEDILNQMQKNQCSQMRLEQ